jgi:hypothetical protein
MNLNLLRHLCILAALAGAVLVLAAVLWPFHLPHSGWVLPACVVLLAVERLLTPSAGP